MQAFGNAVDFAVAGASVVAALAVAAAVELEVPLPPTCAAEVYSADFVAGLVYHQLVYSIKT